MDLFAYFQREIYEFETTLDVERFDNAVKTLRRGEWDYQTQIERIHFDHWFDAMAMWCVLSTQVNEIFDELVHSNIGGYDLLHHHHLGPAIVDKFAFSFYMFEKICMSFKLKKGGHRHCMPEYWYVPKWCNILNTRNILLPLIDDDYTIVDYCLKNNLFTKDCFKCLAVGIYYEKIYKIHVHRNLRNKVAHAASFLPLCLTRTARIIDINLLRIVKSFLY